MSDLRELYQELILDHNRRPRNFGPLPGADHQAVGHNPLCGDRISVSVRMEGEMLREVRFEGSGCAISKASASMMTEALKGKTRTQAEALFRTFHALVTEGAPATGADLGKLGVFSGVREYPVRVKCATLAWHTLKAALDGAQGETSTE
jgi:nitrogen fixation NifU-like protein